MTPWSESTDAAQQIEDTNAGWRDELATQRATDWTDIYDEREPSPCELEQDNQ